jgi:hypothetical protein
MLVTFEDLTDPSSVLAVNPDDLSATFGDGISLKRITVELTDDPVTHGIVQRLKWLPDVHGALVHVPMSEYPPPGNPLPLHLSLTAANFKSGE